MADAKKKEVWFLTGSQHLYGEATLRQVAEHTQRMVGFLDGSGRLPVKLVWKPTLTRPDEITEICLAANAAPECVGVVTWMHTFSPAKMWIGGLTRLQKPLAHLHTQFNRELPWADIDMDFMNLNQAAHGDREFGFLGARLRLPRKIIVGFWQDDEVLDELAGFCKVALAVDDSRRLKIARFGGTNMREVAVTGGDRVEAQIQLGWAVNGYPVGALVKRIAEVSEAEVTRLCEEYEASYTVVPELRKGGARHEELRHAARQEIGMRALIEGGGFGAFTTTFEDLYGLHELPGLASQRLMAAGFGFAAEGDWKTAALVRLFKVMSGNAGGGVSFMEDYTYHLTKGNELVLGAHMLEVCPSIAAGKPTMEIHPLGIGGKADPCRLVFEGRPGPAVAATLVDVGGRMRLIVHELDAVQPPERMPKLPVARAVWVPRPDFKRGCAAWILAGGAHHTAYTLALSGDLVADLGKALGLEVVRIGAQTDLRALENELRWNDAAHKLGV